MPSPLDYALTTTSFMTGNPQIDSLIFGTQWLSPDFYGDDFFSTRLTYSFVKPGQSYFARDYSPVNEFLNSYALTAGQQSAVTSALNAWSAVANVKFTLVNDDITSAGDIRFGGYAGMDPKTAAWAYYPDRKPLAGDVWIGPTTDNPAPGKGTYDYMTFIHEIGHALGLKHPFDPTSNNSNVISPLLDDSHYTLMSYNNTYSFQPTTPMLLDILAIQKLYGANTLWQTGNNIYKWAPNQSVFETIWDAGGNDTIDASNQLDAVHLNLNEGGFSQIGKAFLDTANQSLVKDGLAIAFGTKIENAIGSEFDDTLIGNALDNVLDGRGGADTMAGGDGNDTYVVDNAGDIVIELGNAAGGKDTVLANFDYTLGANLEYLTLYGTGNFNATGNDLNNRVYGNAGNNILDGGLGTDVLKGGAGNDTYIVDNIGDVIIEESTLASEIDTVKSSVNWTLGDNLENLILTGTANTAGVGNALNNVMTGNDGNNAFNGGAGNDQLYGGAGNDELNGGTGADALYGGTGDDVYYIDNAGDSVIELEGEGHDLVKTGINYTLASNVEDGLILGSAAINLTGNSLDNVLTGNAAANVLDGGVGADTLIGGDGNDTYVVDNEGDVVVEQATATAGVDTVLASVNYTLGANVEYLTLTGTGNINGSGNALNNRVYGNAGNNILDGGLGTDVLMGGAGNDTYIVDNVKDVIIESSTVASEIDTVMSSVNWTLGDNLENLTLTGTANIAGVGNALNNVLTGNDGNNAFNGGAGLDTMIGGDGNDTYFLDQSGELNLLQENANQGSDLVYITYAVTAQDFTVDLSQTNLRNVENVTLTGTGAFTVIGNEQDNVLIGNASNNNLQGGAGNDLLDGGLGADTLSGGTGDDVYLVDNVADVIIELENEGHDLVKTTVSYTLSANVEDAILLGTALNLTGNSLSNVLTGNAQANVLDGGAGADTLEGGDGNDTYIVDNSNDVVIEQATATSGVDTVLASVNYTLGANVEYLTLTGTGNINGTGNALNNRVYGNAGNNILDGGLGTDVLMGGAGNDTYIVDNVKDVIIESSTIASEIDTVMSSVNWTLGDNLENLTLTGTANVAGIGNASDNVMIGNDGNNAFNGGAGDDQLFGGAGNDELNGGTGADALYGGTGDDVYIIDNIGDTVIELDGEGHDLIKTAISYTLSSHVEDGLIIGAKALNLTGNDLNNVLTGNEAANILDGGLGADTLIGGDGNDTYVVDNAGDVVIEQATATGGVDTVLASVSYTLGANVEYLTLTGTDDISGTGNALNNRVYGNDGNNTLDGGLGTDVLMGGAGNDTYIVDNIKDVIIESSAIASEIDTVMSSVNWTLGANLENLTLIGTANIAGIGNELNNVMIGNDGNNAFNGGAGVDQLFGGAGNDILNGQSGADTLTGGTGADRFVFTGLGDTGLGSQRDVITDFSSLEGDKLDFSQFDANLSLAGLNKFTFIDGNEFTGAGQLRFVDHMLYGNVNGDLGADFEIQLVGVNSFSANDLVA